ncbi:glycosyltransferase involved in cell wall biosynthesis [Anaerobacterium chartisolvens]|uniref:Glycosyltransferase involved in cell wall biosynthesis n=1 Tax=Anaerobacterium chartisolvens TaxID=1297424 RepID=A0A369ANM2_9FIRM|nr:glycosyltransferase family 2 protein [Anaerobacterium chartisolvens]RCX09876.1 glycosyltransferase involved in cell wall biosynthesis [Anaerobacterium chartisolvens]
MYKITFYTHAYNTEKYMEQCIKSVLTQSVKDIEYIIVDNGSTDGTKNIIAEYAKKDSRIKAIRFEENRKGFWPKLIKDLAQGEYFSMLDSDDWYEPEFAETLLGLAENEALDIAVAGSCFHFLSENSQGYRKSESKLIVSREAFPSQFEPMYKFFRPVWGKLFKMSMIKNMDFSDYYAILNYAYGADTVVCLKSLSIANRIGISDKVLHNYRVHPQSVSYVYNPNRFYSDTFLFRKAESFLSCFGKISGENYHFLYVVYINAALDTIDIILKENLEIYQKLLEIGKILKEPLTQQAISAANIENDRLKAYRQLLIDLFVNTVKVNSGNKDIVDLACSNILLLNKELSLYVNRDNLSQHFKSGCFLLSAVNLNSDEMLKKAILSLDSKSLSESMWNILTDMFKSNILLSWIDNPDFALHYYYIIAEVFNLRASSALNMIIEILNNGKEIPFEEELLLLCLNVSAAAEDGEVFVFVKKLQTQLFIRQKRFDEAWQALNDLLEMCPEDGDVVTLKKWLEEENE